MQSVLDHSLPQQFQTDQVSGQSGLYRMQVCVKSAEQNADYRGLQIEEFAEQNAGYRGYRTWHCLPYMEGNVYC